MIKKWIYRILALGLIVFVLINTRQYYNTKVAEYNAKRAEQREIWDQKAEWNAQAKQDNPTQDNTKTDPVVSVEPEPSFVFEPSEATGDDFYLNLSSISLWESGEYLTDSGEKAENKRRLRYPELIEVECPQYIVTLTEGFTLYICEYDADNAFLRSLAFKNTDKYEVSKNCVSFSVSLRRDEQEKSLSLGQWNSVFGSGLKIIICTENRLEN